MLLEVLQVLLDNGATVIVIEHDLDVIRNADYIIDMGPGGGDAGGRVVACGTPQKLRQTQTVLQADFCEQGEKIISVDSITGFRKKAFICAVRYN